MSISKAPFGSVDGNEVDLYTLENANGVVAKITNYGGIVTSLVVPDSEGNKADIVCGFDTLEGYFSEAYKGNSPYFGCLVGRYAARVKDGAFNIDGVDFKVATNDGPNHLHGGIKGFDKCVWCASVDGDSLKLTLRSPDGDEGYPGNLDVVVTYTLTDDNELCIDYSATTDKATPLSLTNHTYFNLGGFQDKILSHRAQIASDKYLLPDDTNVPVGDEFTVAGTVWDYKTAKPLGDVFGESPMGFETYYVFSKPVGEFAKVAEFADAASGRKMEVSTSEPGMLMYSGFYTSDELKRESGAQFGQFRAFCCETSRYPNGPNIEGAPGSILAPGDTYSQKTIFKLIW
ncbi:MAG: aldose epimerase family protein [Puniceicoccaceae bacterium]